MLVFTNNGFVTLKTFELLTKLKTFCRFKDNTTPKKVLLKTCYGKI